MSKYFKHISSLGFISVFGEQEDMTCQYLCTTPFLTTVVGLSDFCMGRVSNMNERHEKRQILIDNGQNISYEEYQSHIRFCLAICLARINGNPMRKKVRTKEISVFDYSNYYE